MLWGLTGSLEKKPSPLDQSAFRDPSLQKHGLDAAKKKWVQTFRSTIKLQKAPADLTQILTHSVAYLIDDKHGHDDCHLALQVAAQNTSQHMRRGQQTSCSLGSTGTAADCETLVHDPRKEGLGTEKTNTRVASGSRTGTR